MASCCSRGAMSQQMEGDIAQLLLPQREEWSVCPGLWLFSGFLRDEYLFSPVWDTDRIGRILGTSLGAAENKKELGGMLLFLRTSVQKTDSGGSKNLSAPEKKSFILEIYTHALGEVTSPEKVTSQSSWTD